MISASPDGIQRGVVGNVRGVLDTFLASALIVNLFGFPCIMAGAPGTEGDKPDTVIKYL